MSKSNKGKKHRGKGTIDTQIEKMLERSNAWKTRNMLIKHRRKQR